MAAAEGLDAHKEAVTLRLARIKQIKETPQS
jgi:histidinol dehydrogenase